MSAVIVPLHSSPVAAIPADTFSYSTPGSYTWQVPTGVDTVEVEVRGGAGGNDEGGSGGVVTSTLDVSSITSLSLQVASRGGDGEPGGGSSSWGSAGSGYGQGGRGGTGSYTPFVPSAGQGGGGGGGASAVSSDGAPLIIAGGGGGGGGYAVCGGNPGGDAGQSGWKYNNNCASNGGDPGAGGAASGRHGSQGSNANSSSGQGGGGGGGGGYRGGGGADASTDGGGGGGGGTSYCAAGNCSMTVGNWGNGSIEIRPIHTPTVTFDEDAYSAHTGNTLTFSGTVTTPAPSGGVPEGHVTLSVENDGAQETHTLATLPLNAQGQFSYTCTSPCGTEITNITQVRASYQSSNQSSWRDAAGVAPLTFVNAETQTQLFIDPSQAVAGQLRDFTATVQVLQPALGAVRGNVEFWMSNQDGSIAELLGTEPLADNYQVTLSVGVPEAVTKRFWAVFAGSAGFNGSQSPKQTLMTEQAATKIVATTTPQPTVTGQSFEMQTTVTVRAPGAGIPTGEVQVLGENGTHTVILDSAGEANVPWEGLDAGEYEFTVHYLGDENFLPAQTTVTHTVERADADLGLAVDNPTSQYGEDVVLTASATVVSPGDGEITGDVQFGYLNEAGEFIPLKDPVALHEELAQLIVTGLDVANYEFQARYIETDNFLAAVSPLAEHTVFQAAPIVTVTPQPETTTYGLSQLAAITVSGPDYGNGAPLPADGEVQLIFVHEDGTETPFTDAITLDEAGKATVDLDGLDPGNYQMYAVYDGSRNYLTGVSETAEFTVEQALPNVTLSGEEKATAGQAHTFTVEVAPYAASEGVAGDPSIVEDVGTLTLSPLMADRQEHTWLGFVPTGEINLLIDGEVVAADVALTAHADGRMAAVATVTHTFDTPGSYHVVAEYGGDTYVLSGESNTLDVQVTSAAAASAGLAQTGMTGAEGMLGSAALLMLAGVTALTRYRSRKIRAHSLR
ncbi:Ig-like domain-containing protein [Leucobacter sp. UCMA 4100]|uniref:Ig-like domain-containing protein n=1 Tax=Leucobacter sp. UCMA 4100 TaxID=2810534 RepID=UPI002FDBC95C